MVVCKASTSNMLSLHDVEGGVTGCGARRPANQHFELGEATTVNRVSPAYLATHRPVALLALVPRAAVLFGAGAASGAIAKSLTAPLDRVKLLLQVKGGLGTDAVSAAAAKGNLVLGDVAGGTPGYVLLRNLDGTNFVQFGADADAPFGKLKAGEAALLRVVAAPISIKADTAACAVEYWVLAD